MTIANFSYYNFTWTWWPLKTCGPFVFHGRRQFSQRWEPLMGTSPQYIKSMESVLSLLLLIFLWIKDQPPPAVSQRRAQGWNKPHYDIIWQLKAFFFSRNFPQKKNWQRRQEQLLSSNDSGPPGSGHAGPSLGPAGRAGAHCLAGASANVTFFRGRSRDLSLALPWSKAMTPRRRGPPLLTNRADPELPLNSCDRRAAGAGAWAGGVCEWAWFCGRSRRSFFFVLSKKLLLDFRLKRKCTMTEPNRADFIRN